MAAAGIEPLEHYLGTGWREARDPAPWFDTAFYLGANPDVRGARLDPFWHYLAAGRREGRAPAAPDDSRSRQLRHALDAARPAAPDSAVRHAEVPLVDLRAALAGARRLVLAIGHDDYATEVGGVQAVTADERRAFARAGFAYLHVSPTVTLATLAPLDPAPLGVRLRLDSALIGVTTWGGLRLALPRDGVAGADGRLVVHSLLGHRPEDVARLWADWRPGGAVFWVHDYATLCESAQLLRNDTWSCRAPPSGSAACRVCLHGVARPPLVARMRALFAAVPFDVLAPSAVALATWVRAGGLPHASARVHLPVRLVPRGRVATPLDARLRVGFVGRRLFHKGWPFFLALLPWARATGAAALFHLATPDALAPVDGIEGIPTATTPDDPDAAIRAIRACRLDFVLVLSPWPETFCLVAHEALAAGARVVCLAAGGHVAELVRRTGRGVVLPDEAALLPFFASGAALAERDRIASVGGGVALRRTGGAAAFVAPT